MPTYEYECVRCGKRLEVFQSIKDAPKRICPKCKGRLRRMISMGAGMIFKGSGFYITDYRSKNYKEAAKKEAGAGSAKAEGKAKSETKAAPAASGDKK